jgi:hypothetical protein
VGDDWRECIVTLIDLKGIRNRAEDSVGSTLMRQLHKTVISEVQSGAPSISHAYAWNDSVLLLSFVDTEQATYQDALRAVDTLKKKIDKIRHSYAIAVKGRAFPPVPGLPFGIGGRVTVIEASSWAMANCFEIEKKIGSLRKAWYIDERIAKKIETGQACEKHKVRLYPSGTPRNVHVYGDCLWPDEV